MISSLMPLSMRSRIGLMLSGWQCLSEIRICYHTGCATYLQDLFE